MTPLQIALIILLVLIFVAGMITYFIRKNYYKQIDELDQQKKELFNQAPYDELKEVKELSITGQSSELRDQFKEQWKEIETLKYPKIENYLFEAEQATDRYRLNESKKNQKNAQEMIINLKSEINQFTSSLNELIEREQANLKKIDKIKKKYHEVRKSLLAYSFSFGPASESFEEKLNLMEKEFTEFSEHTVSGDHEEANKIIENLSEDIETMEKQMDQIPPLLNKINEDYEGSIEDLNEGYKQMVEYDYLFPNDNILENIEALDSKKEQILEAIRLLKIDEADKYMDQISINIEQLYDEMEKEIESERKVYPLLKDVKEAIYYLRDEIRRLESLEQRLTQSYVLFHDEASKLESMDREINSSIEKYQIISEKIHENEIPYSIAHHRLKFLFQNLDKLNDSKIQLDGILNSYRSEELNFKDEIFAMEEAMYDMKRALENKRLPGLPDNYLELFFSTTKRIEQLFEELARTKISLVSFRKDYKIAEEDVIQLSQMTEEIIDQVNLIERISQRLYRFKDDHKGILETIRYSESLFNDDYDYKTSLRLLKEKLENVAPGVYDELVKEYEEEKANHSF